MDYGLIHYNAPGDSLQEFLRYAKDTGFDCVELSIGDVWGEGVSEPEQRAEEVKAMLDELSLSVSALSAGNDFVVLDGATIAEQVQRMKRICQLAQILDCNVIRTEGGVPKDEVPQARWAEAIAGCLLECLEFAEPMGIKFAVDNHGGVTNEWPVQVEVFRRVDSPLVGANLDTMNYRWFGHSPEMLHEIYEQITPHVIHTHLKDGFGGREDYRGQALGEGEIDLAWAVQCLKQAGYRGVWCAEYEGREDTAIGYRKCLAWMKANC